MTGLTPLSPRIKLFVSEYLKDFNGSAAAKRAGYSASGARQTAFNILAKPAVREYMRAISKLDETVSKISAERVVEELARIAINDIGDYYFRNKNDVLQLKPLDQMTPAQRACIAEIDPVEGKIRFHDKLSALDKLGRHYKLFTELHEQQLNFTMMGNVVFDGVEMEFHVGKKPPKK